MRFEAGHRARNPRPAADRVEDLLRLQHRVRRARRTRTSARSASAFPGALPVLNRARRRLRHPRRARARLHDPRDVDLRAQELLLSRPAEGLPDLAVRAAARDAAGSSSTGRAVRIGITRIHMEEDAGKSLHEGFADSIAQDLRRLQPQRRAAHRDRHRARPALRGGRPQPSSARLREILVWLGVNDGNMEEGSLRCDANVSVRRAGEATLGTKAEVKNLNSFRFLQKALEYEIERQIDVARAAAAASCRRRGCGIRPPARTVSMRSKEEAHDYRYFPDPDLPPLVVDAARIAPIRGAMPELPEARRQRFVAAVRAARIRRRAARPRRARLADYFEAAVAAGAHAEGGQQLDDGRAGARAEGTQSADIAASPVPRRAPGRTDGADRAGHDQRLDGQGACSRRCSRLGPHRGGDRRSRRARADRRRVADRAARSPRCSPRTPTPWRSTAAARRRRSASWSAR